MSSVYKIPGTKRIVRMEGRRTCTTRKNYYSFQHGKRVRQRQIEIEGEREPDICLSNKGVLVVVVMRARSRVKNFVISINFSACVQALDAFTSREIHLSRCSLNFKRRQKFSSRLPRKRKTLRLVVPFPCLVTRANIRESRDKRAKKKKEREQRSERERQRLHSASFIENQTRERANIYVERL